MSDLYTFYIFLDHTSGSFAAICIFTFKYSAILRDSNFCGHHLPRCVPSFHKHFFSPLSAPQVFKSAVSPYQAEVPHWEQWCPQLKEAVLCALWVGSGENSYELARALIGGSPPLGFGWEYSGEAKEKAITKCKHKSQLYLLQECGVVNARSEGCRTAVDPHWETDRGRERGEACATARELLKWKQSKEERERPTWKRKLLQAASILRHSDGD